MSKSGFKSIHVKFNKNRDTLHEFFIKQHKLREESNERPSDLTLFVCNVPPFCSEECLKCIFTTCGDIKSIYFASAENPLVIKTNNKDPYIHNQDEIKGYKIAYIVFQSALGLQAALSLKSETPISLPDINPLVTGLQKWCSEYNDTILDPLEMRKEINLYMSKHDVEVTLKNALDKYNAEEDTEGWVAVSKRGRNPGFARKKSVKDNIIKMVKRKNKRKMLLNFYNFQIKESKMNHIANLRKKFEEDKKKVEALKSQRKFKPF